ncbi:MAG: RrF2 family transcriptional regulator [Planctomycetaceae bacterium]|jgi:Rrf2 family nitric oxide-sensitive transcriptional repressor
MLSQTVEYALRAAVYLANQAPLARTTEQIAEVTKVPQAYLSKVMQNLAKAGIVRSQRGIHGGFLLARSSAELTILEVVNAVDPVQRIQTCPLGIAAHGANLCPLHRRLDLALAAVENAFGKTTLAEVLSEPTRSVPLCGMTIPAGAACIPLDLASHSPGKAT